MSSGTRTRGEIWWWLTAALWIAVAIPFLGLLAYDYERTSDEPTLLDCAAPGADSAFGVPRWQWVPPGRYCELRARPAEGVPTSSTFDHPGSWRSAVGLGLLLTAGLLIVAAVVSAARPYPQPRAPTEERVTS